MALNGNLWKYVQNAGIGITKYIAKIRQHLVTKYLQMNFCYKQMSNQVLQNVCISVKHNYLCFYVHQYFVVLISN